MHHAIYILKMHHAPERAGGSPPPTSNKGGAGATPAVAGAAGAYPPHPQITPGNPMTYP